MQRDAGDSSTGGEENILQSARETLVCCCVSFWQISLGIHQRHDEKGDDFLDTPMPK